MSYTGLPNKIAATSENGINSWNLTGGTGWSGDIWTGIGEQNDYTYAGVNLQTDQGGTLTFEFSQNGTDWTKYPVTEFTIVGGINEVHGAWKGTRYIRPKFTGNSGETRTYFRIRTMYSDVPIQLTAPLNQSIGADSDATITRAVGIGENPTGSYVNQKIDGIGFQTTDNLASGATFSSDTIDAQGYTQVQTHIVCDNDGTLGFKFCSTANCTGTTPGQNGVERYLSVPYSSSGGFQLFSAPAFTPYVQYTFTNNGTGTTTQLFYETKLLTKSLSGQLLGMDAFIAPSMVANLGRNVQVGKDPNGTFTNVKVDGVAFRTETPLSGTGVYTSPITSTEGYSQIETHLYADVAGTLVGRWYTDENKTTLIRSFTRPYSNNEVGNVSYFSAPVFGPYLEYEYTNGSVAQTSFFLDFHPRTKGISGQVLGMNDFIPAGVVANLGRNVLVGQDEAGNFRNTGVDAEGHLKVHIDEPLTAFGEIKIAEMTPVVQVTFPYNINPLLVSTTTSNGGSVTQGDNMVILQTSGVTGSLSELSTINVAKYRAGQGIVGRFTGLFTTGATTSDSRQIIGIGDNYDGYFFGMSGNTFGIHHRINSGTTFTPQSDFSIDVMDGSLGLSNPSGVLFNPTKGNVFQIQYQWLGYGSINFFIESEVTGQYEPVHQISYTNKNTVPSSYNPTFPIHAEISNGTSTDVLTMKSASMAAFVEGRNEITGPLQSANGTNAGGNDGELLVLRNVSVFPSGSTTTNKTVAYLRDMSIANDGGNNTIVRVQIIEDPVYSVSPTYTYIDPNNSIIQVGTTGTYTPGSGKVIASFAVTQVGGITVDLSTRNIAIRPGKTIGFITQGDTSTSTELDISWVEDF